VSPAVAPKEEQEDEEATESARNSMAIYDPEEQALPPLSLIALMAIAAGAGVGIRRASRGRRTRRAPELAQARAQCYDWLR
jgi:predicted hotdog family 3-hydroxylacyl-ACP dehydratase